jgi:cell division protein YceG involved in septum cleavage
MWRLRFFGMSPILSNHFFKIISATMVVVLFFGIFYIFSWRPPSPFPPNALITVERGEHLSQIANSFEEKRIIIFFLHLTINLRYRKNYHLWLQMRKRR